MNKKIFIVATVLVSLLLGMQSCNEDNFFADKDKFADLNSDPSVVSEPDIRFLISRAEQQMYNNDYTIWFYTYNDYVFPYSQVAASTNGGNTTTFNEGGLTGLHNLYASLVPGVDARMRIDGLNEDEMNASQAMKAITYAIQIYVGISNFDYIGGMSYSEAGLANYTSPPLLTPKMDTEQELLNLWLTELDEAIADLGKADQFSLGNQDMMYKGDYTKWLKFANLLKLRIAARLVNADRAKALQVAQQVASSSYMDDLGDDLLYNSGVNYRGTGNGVGDGWIGYAGNNLIEFLKANRDPRLRFIFRKNNFNPEVIDAIIETNGVAGLPSKIRDIINLNGEGKFDSWKTGFEEPWGRYWGVPLSTTATTNNEYFQQSTLFYATKTDGSSRKTYTWSSVIEEKNQRTTLTYTYPTKPGGAVIQVVGNQVPLYVLLGSAAETNLYLAEFKLLGANLPGSAQDYFTKGVTLSIQRMDNLAQRHQIPYYNEDPVLANPEEGAAKLKDGEIADLLTNEAFLLNGTDNLEKVYIQQYVHNLITPGDLWTTVRRSGIPKIGSSYFAWEDFGVGNIPRRVAINTPSEADLMYDILKDYYQQAGITTNTNTASVLSSERLWFDKNNPDYGAGPKN
ncbi:SusD/RagB family nutrient-binding outer membrane lipoprotein [Maribellus sp. YY47]|uniref:SusD/RagB family nutrient-binding outer membrane lipoprotein n=1 Tax=Maribellus sp. YY47 TaxID=2929486 RepID=UPI002000A784|nr:SusD/RagB family nutrient-binding outer membrane lipoprotein [Maribellus sp. YY47]MCK3684295.1 SusD/RagB family nutrient-binding outer membrane lipoprotein [Maribellus sp. YY47]